MVVNFISKEEKEITYSHGQIISSKTLNKYGKIVQISYLNIEKEKYLNFNRKSDILVEFFVAGINEYFNEFHNVNTPYYIHYRYHSRNFKFETMVPTTVPNLLNFRYYDQNGFCYFTVVNKETNRICEAGFYDVIEMNSLNATKLIVDYPDRNVSQERLFDRSKFYYEKD